MRRTSVAFISLLSLLPGQTAAHLISTRFGELYSGMLHPVTTLQHLIPWLALGLLGGLQKATTTRWVLLAFSLGVLIGLAGANLISGLPFVESLNLASFVILGLLIAFNMRLASTIFISLVVLFGLSHGYANAASDIHGFKAVLYAIGVGLTAYLLIALVSGPTYALVTDRSWATIAVRAAGSWIAAAGLMYGGFMLTTT